jgi:hypothetical protein
MKTLYAVTLAAAIAVGGGALLIAAEQPGGTSANGSGGQAASGDGVETLPPKDQSKPESDEGTGAAGGTASTIDVHRHRPGACPEGPPCKVGD